MGRRPWTIACWCVLLAACSVPIEHFARADAAAPGDAAESGDDGDAGQLPPFAPLHVPPDAIVSDAPDLALHGDPTSIDTTALTIDAQTSPYFVHVGNYAVLFAGALSIDGPVEITGSSPLIMIARGAITVAARVDLGAVAATPGPGASSGNVGAGGSGTSVHLGPPADVQLSSGGGGGGYGTPGAGAAAEPAGRRPVRQA